MRRAETVDATKIMVLDAEEKNLQMLLYDLQILRGVQQRTTWIKRKKAPEENLQEQRKGLSYMLKLFGYIFMLPFYVMMLFFKLIFWVPLILLGLIFDDGGPGPGSW